MKRKIALFIAIVLWSGAIFMFSAQSAEGSKELSKSIAEKIISFAKMIFGDDFISESENENESTVSLLELATRYLRKIAHFFLFFVLGILCFIFISECGVAGWKRFGFALIYCILYAASDEIHQLFVPGRAGMIRDVIIDTCGSLTGMGLCAYIKSIRKKRKEMTV